MRVLTFSRQFPAGHPKNGQPTYFVEKIWKSVWDNHVGASNPLYPWWENYDKAFPVTYDINENIHQHAPKLHTIRSGNNWKPGDQFSARVWSGAPYKSKQVEFAQVEIKKVWDFKIAAFDGDPGKLCFWIDDKYRGRFNLLNTELATIAANDGLTPEDFISWFSMHPKKKEQKFYGQVICWNENIEY